MSQRTILEINHDRLNLATARDLIALLNELGLSGITGALNAAGGKPLEYRGGGITILAQRHHSEDLTVKIGKAPLLREVKA